MCVDFKLGADNQDTMIEIKRILIEHDVLSSLDTVMLLLVPLASFIIAIRPWLIGPDLPLRPLAGLLVMMPFISLIPLILLLHAKFTGSFVQRVRAWTSFFYIFIVTGLLLSISELILRIFGNSVVVSMLPVLLLCFIAVPFLVHALASYPIRVLGRTLKNRIPWKSPEIEAAFGTFILRRSYISRRKAAIEFIFGLVVLICVLILIQIENLPVSC